jgi:hypothetical protein
MASKIEPLWIGIELYNLDGSIIKVCVGVSQEDGHEVSFKLQDDENWTNDTDIIVKRGTDVRVFGKNDNLLKR